MAIRKERSYYRMCPNSDLIEEARNKPNAELAAALGERLQSLLMAIEDAGMDASELLHRN
jgi:hypothetical protein